LWRAAFCVLIVAFSLPVYAQSTAQTTVIGTATGALTSLMQASDDNIYGVIQGNGASCHSYGTACGNLIQLELLGSLPGANGANSATPFNVISFQSPANGTSGFYPANILEDPQSILYGATEFGGTGAGSSQCSGLDDACGTLYQFYYDQDVAHPSDLVNSKVVHDFTATENGQGAPLTLGSDGNYYGGGANIYKITPAGDFTRLAQVNLYQSAIGSLASQLVEGDDGYYYGTALYGDNCGGIFQMDPSSGLLTSLYAMPEDGSQGCVPVGQLVEGPDGAFYGITDGYSAPGGLANIFRITKSGSFSVLHTLSLAEGTFSCCGLTLGSDGVLYGAATEGGGAAACPFTNGCGTIFSITTSGTFTVLHTFQGGQDGAYPTMVMQMSSTNPAFGGTLIGGAGGDGKAGSPAGVIFQVTLPPGHQASPVQIEMFKQSDMSPVTSTSQIDPSTPLVLEWQVLNAYSNTMQSCYAHAHNPSDHDGEADWSGKQTGTLSSVGYTGQTVVTPQFGGAYDYTLTCGGVESAVFNLTVQNTLAIVTASLPDATVDQSYSLTFAASGGKEPYTWSVVGGGLPPGLNLDGPTGIFSGTPKQFGSYSFTVQAKDSSPTPEIVTAQLTMTVNNGLAINPTSLPQAVINKSYSQTITVTGGLPPYTETISAGALPDGLTLNAANGTIAGTPTKVGTFNFTFSVADAENPKGSSTQSYTVKVVASLLTIDAATLGQAGAGNAFSQVFAATGGVTPYTWTVASGTLPKGLTLSSAGVLSGTPQQYGPGSPFTIQVSDAETPAQTAAASFTLPVQNTLTITTTTMPTAIVGVKYSAAVAATGGIPPYTWAAGANLSSLGLSIDPSTGVISGIPLVAATFQGGVAVADSEGTPAQDSADIILPVASANDAVSSTTLTTSSATGAVGEQLTFTATVSVSGGTPTGIITFAAGTTTLGTAKLNVSGVATLTTTFSATGVYNVIASYNGDDDDLASASKPLTETIVAPSVTTAISPDSITITPGASGTLTITITPVGSYTGTANFSCGTLPASVSCTFAPPSITLTAGGGVQTDTLTINTAATKSALLSSPFKPRGFSPIYSAMTLWLPGSLVALSGMFRRRQTRRFTRRLWLLGLLWLGLVSAGHLCGCAGGSANDARPGTYTIPVELTLTSGTTQTVNATIIVK
jgi:uncharacterized repeat protein (TIGR03803 family)